MSINPYDSPIAAGQAPARKPGLVRFRLLELLVVVCVIGILIAFLLPAVRTSGEAARRASCSNNLKQIALALQNYESVHHSLPPAYTVDAEGKPLHSWRTLILPYLEQQALYEKIDLSKPWDHPANKPARDTRVAAYQCPSANLPVGQTTYLAVVCPSSCLQAAQPRLLAEITDDHGLTLVVMEVDTQHAVHWMSPLDASEQLIVNSVSSDRLAHPGGTQVLFVSGQVRFLIKNLKPATLRAAISIAGKDDDTAREVN